MLWRGWTVEQEGEGLLEEKEGEDKEGPS